MTVYIGNESGMKMYAQIPHYGYVTDQALLCRTHSRNMALQPFFPADRQQGFGRLGCPFCQGGLLEGKYSLYRSQKTLLKAVEELAYLDLKQGDSVRFISAYVAPVGYTGVVQSVTAHYYFVNQIAVPVARASEILTVV